MSDSSEPAANLRYIDLHSHTTASDGTLAPGELVALAKKNDLEAIAITDHDTFAGYDEAIKSAAAFNLDVVCGIELNSRLSLGEDHRAVHLLGYWPLDPPSRDFREWLNSEREDRRNRNRRLAEALQSRNVDVTLDEVEARGRNLAGRAHFARILVEKGYAQNHDDAFRRYLGESAPTYVERQSRTTEEIIAKLREADGIPVTAHPIRLSVARDREREVLVRLKQAGLLGLEIYHSEHPPEAQAHYRQLAEELGLLPTGGSDFHGAPKPNIDLGTGLKGNIRVPFEFLERMRQYVRALQ